MYVLAFVALVVFIASCTPVNNNNSTTDPNDKVISVSPGVDSTRVGDIIE